MNARGYITTLAGVIIIIFVSKAGHYSLGLFLFAMAIAYAVAATYKTVKNNNKVSAVAAFNWFLMVVCLAGMAWQFALAAKL